jgi:hypothetical protein
MNQIIDYKVITNVVTTEEELKEFQDTVGNYLLSGDWKPLGGVSVDFIRFKKEWKIFFIPFLVTPTFSYSQALIKVEK